MPSASFAQYKDKKAAEEAPKTETELIIESARSAETPVVITLEQALEIALSENVSVKVADMEIERTGYAKKGAYAALFPQIDASGAYQRTIKKQVMYMDVDMSSIMGGGIPGGNGGGTGDGGAQDEGQIPETAAASKGSGGGIEVGR